jgi:hypothetical protein
VAKQIEARPGTVKWPTGGQYIGDWREGEKLAQNGRGMTWTDKSAAAKANGGSCYNCHQIGKAGDLLRHHRPQPVQLRQEPRRDRRAAPRPSHRRVHLGQALQQQGLQRLLQHAAFRPLGLLTKSRCAPDGAAAGPEVAVNQ